MIKKIISHQRETSQPPPNLQHSLQPVYNKNFQQNTGSQISNHHKKVQDILQETDNEDSQSSQLEVQEVQHIEMITGQNDELIDKKKQRMASLNRDTQRQGYYNKMIPSFTNEKRRNLYFNHPKKGFGYVNWNIEEELWRFQKEIEDKFAISLVNRNFKFPFLKEYQPSSINTPGRKPVVKKQASNKKSPARISNLKIFEMNSDQKTQYIKSILNPYRPDSILVQGDQSKYQLQRQKSDLKVNNKQQHQLKKQEDDKKEQIQQKHNKASTQLFQVKDVIHSPRTKNHSNETKTPQSLYAKNVSNKSKLTQSSNAQQSTSRNSKIAKVGNYSSQSYKGNKHQANKSIIQNPISKITDFNSISIDPVTQKSASVLESQQAQQSQAALPQQKYSQSQNQVLAKQSRNRQVYNKSINLSHKSGGFSILQPSTNITDSAQSKQNPSMSRIDSSYKKSVITSIEISKNTSIIQSAKPKLESKIQPIIIQMTTLAPKPESSRKKLESSSKRQLPIFQTKCLNDKGKFSNIKSHLNFDSIHVEQPLTTNCQREITQISGSMNYVTQQTEEAQLLFDNGVMHTEPMLNTQRQGNISTISFQFNKNTPNSKLKNLVSQSNKNNQISNFYQSFSNANKKLLNYQKPIIIKSRNANLVQTQASNESLLGTKGGVGQRQLSNNDRQDKFQGPMFFGDSNEYSLQNNTRGSNHHHMTVKDVKMRYDSSLESLNPINLQNNLMRNISQNRETERHLNNPNQVVKVDKHLVRNSSPTKTNLDTLNKSIERQIHQRSMTMTNYNMNTTSHIMIAGQDSYANIIQRSPIRLDDQYKQHVSRFDQFSQDRKVSRNNLAQKNHHPLSNSQQHVSLKPSGYTLFKNESEGFQNSNYMDDIDENQPVEYYNENPITENLTPNTFMQSKEAKCSIIEECVGTFSNNSSVIESKTKGKTQIIYNLINSTPNQQNQRFHGNSDQTVLSRHLKTNSAFHNQLSQNNDYKSSGRISPAAFWQVKTASNKYMKQSPGLVTSSSNNFGGRAAATQSHSQNKKTPKKTSHFKGMKNMTQTSSQLQKFIDKSNVTTKTSTIYLTKPTHKQNQLSLQNGKQIMNQSGQVFGSQNGVQQSTNGQSHRRTLTKHEMSFEVGGSCEILNSNRKQLSGNNTLTQSLANPLSYGSHITMVKSSAPNKNQTIGQKIENPQIRHSNNLKTL